jgi:hypothetical protein
MISLFSTYMQSIGDVGEHRENDVSAEKGLGKHHSPVGRVIQGALEPLTAMCMSRILHNMHHINGTILYVVWNLWQSHEVAREAANSLGPHGVSLVGHGAGPDLILLKRLLNLHIYNTSISMHRVEGSKHISRQQTAHKRYISYLLHAG